MEMRLRRVKWGLKEKQFNLIYSWSWRRKVSRMFKFCPAGWIRMKPRPVFVLGSREQLQ